MAKYFLGVDTGATKTHALIADETGRIVGLGRGGSGNHESVGYDGVRLALSTAVGQALQMAALVPTDIAGAGFGIAGYDWPSEKPMTLDAISVLGLTCPLDCVNDMVVGLIAGARKGWGVVIDAGTGNNCRGRTLDGREGMITGHGYFGERGGAGDLVHEAIIRVAHEWSKRGPATRLSQEFLRLTGAKDLTDLLEGITMETYHISASAAPLVFRVAEAGDMVSRDLLAWMGRELGESTLAVIRQLGIQQEQFDVIMIGSLFKGGRLLIDPMIERVHQEAPGAEFIPLLAPPVTGGVMLGMQLAGYDYTLVREQLIDAASKAYDQESEAAEA